MICLILLISSCLSGRTHRSNQISSPEYVFLISALSGEQRFASIVAKRLESLGALTHGDRRATESRDLSKFNVDTKYGRQALESTLKSLVGQEEPTIKMNDYPKNFFERESSLLSYFLSLFTSPRPMLLVLVYIYSPNFSPSKTVLMLDLKFALVTELK